MKRLNGAELKIEKIGVKTNSKDEKTFYTLVGLLNMESINISIKDESLAKQIIAIPDRQTLKVKVDISQWKEEFYLTAKAIL